MARKSATAKAAQEAATKQQTRVTVALAVTPEFAAFLKAGAESAKRSVSVYAAENLAVQLNYTKPAVPARATKRTKYASKEDAKKAQAAKAKERNALMAKLYAQFKAGKIKLPAAAAA